MKAANPRADHKGERMAEKEHGPDQSESSRRDASKDDDVQGHRFSEDLTGDDVQGHRFSEDVTGGDDVAGHVQMTDEEEDTHPRSRG
jgi:hypothetical protein